MTQPIIEVKNLSKEYIISHNVQPYYTLRDSLTRLVKKPFEIFSKKNTSNTKEKFLALNDINFSVMPGEVIGIIGRNGAGKSTLLKVLSQITPPSKGSIHLRGRVASLLEVGTGFHPELTGRENIFLNGAILGMTQKEIKSKFDEIVKFSGVEKFLDTPVKRYSSGMYVRLAFAVAAHLEPEILIVDEVLAVGDAEFQKKCLGKMGEVAKAGRTVIFVSHNMGLIKQLCNKVIILDRGVIYKMGESAEMCNLYSEDITKIKEEDSLSKQILALPGDEIFELESIEMFQDSHVINNIIENGKDLLIQIKYIVKKRVQGLRVYVDVCSRDDNLIFRSFHDEDNENIPFMSADHYISTVVIPKGIFAPREYVVSIHSGIYNKRYTLPIDGIKTLINVIQTSNYNRAYPGDEIKSELALVLNWETHINKNI